MADDSLCVGDYVCLYSEEAYGYCYGYQSSSIFNEVAVWSRQARNRPEVPDVQVVTFKICIANRYKLNKKLRKLEAKAASEPNNLTLKNNVSQANIGADAENEDNVVEQKRQKGKKVLYGQIIQLRHVFTKKYIQVSTTQTSATESSNMQVEMLPFNAKQAQFRVMPRYKVKSEGDVVQVDDQIVLESVKTPGQFLHVSKAAFGRQSAYCGSLELNLSVRQSGFSIYRQYHPLPEDKLRLNAGVPIRLFHKEIEAYLVAEGGFNENVTENVHFRVRVVDQANPKTLFPSTSAITYWQLELEEAAIDGSVIRWEQQCRIKHMTTRKYLKVDPDGKVGLTDGHMDPLNVFRLHAVIKEKDVIEYDTYCRIQHAVTGLWLHADSEEYVRQLGQSHGGSDQSMEGLQWTTSQLKKIGTIAEMQYDDAFTLQQVDMEDVTNFNYMAGMVPTLHKLITDKKGDVILNAKQSYDIINTLSEMKDYMIVQGEPSKKRQKLLRNLRIVELLVQLLQLRYRGSSDSHHMVNIFVEAYDTLYAYLKGDSRKNELYIAKHIPFFQTQIEYAGAVGVNAAHMVMELIKDNRKIVDRITHEHIDSFVSLLSSDKNYRYLDLLSVLCVCDGVSIADNQTYITTKWLEGGKSSVFYTDLGQVLRNDPSLKSKASMFESNVVYVCTNKDKHRVWQALHDFAQERAEKIDEEFMFLTHQLDLFQKLCYGRNTYAIDVITKKLGYLTWEEAFLCLTNGQLPDELRAKYCSLIIGMFVDVGINTSILDHINLTYVYEDIQSGPPGGSDNAAMDGDMKTPRSAETMKYFPQLSEWIASFLDGNKDMTAALIGHNMLVEQVLRLVHYLVKYGYYGNTDDIKTLLDPLLSLLDGRNDKPFPRTGKEGPEFEQVLQHYRTIGRYQQSQETKAIVDAKHQAMEVLDLFFNFRFNTRLERFVSIFKQVHHQTQQGLATPDLAHLLYETYELDKHPHANKAAIKALHDLFAESAYFKGLAIQDILVDLSHYNYNKMVTQSMALLNRFYSAHDYLFKRAVQAQVLVTEKSCHVLEDLCRMLPNLRRLSGAKMNEEQVNEMSTILDKCISFCSLDNEPEEHHPMNQSILYNHEILSDIFDIISQDIDIRLLDQYKGLQFIFQKSFRLLQAMARGNEVVQHRLFDRLDTLLQVQGAEAEMADALTEVFTGNKSTCLRVLPHQIQKIMNLVATHTAKAPQFLDLLNAVVKVEELDLPLKRNQGYVMKYFMQNRSEVAYIIDQPEEERQKILSGGNKAELIYLISLVDLLATCAEGENRFIESICQTIFDIKELLDVLNSNKISNNFKRPYLRFLLWVYLNTAGGMIESGSGDLPHDPRVWEYINGLNDTILVLINFSKKEEEKVKHMLKKAPSKSVDESTDKKKQAKFKLPPLKGVPRTETSEDEADIHGSLHYMFEAVLPFLQVFFRGYYSPDRVNHSQEANYVDTLANNLVTFSDIVGGLISNGTHLKVMVACLSSVLSASTLPVKVMEQFQERYGGGDAINDVRSDARKKYEEDYEAEEELNAQLNVFAVNFSVAYGGENTVENQLGFHSQQEYTDIGGDQELPLGEEYQRFIASFIDESKLGPHKYALAGKLLEQLDISASHTHLTEKERVEKQMLDVKCLQLLRGLIHNEIIKLPEDWELDLKANKKQLLRIEAVQIALNDQEAILKVLPHLAMNSDEIIREVLAFLAAMLFGGNNAVQMNLIKYFFGTREEKFFVAVKNRMQLSAVATKEKRALMAQHQAKIEEAVAQHRALNKAMQAGHAAAAEIMAANRLAGQLGSTLMDMRRSKASLGAAPSHRSKKTLKSRYGSIAKLGSQKSLNKSKTNVGSQLLSSNSYLGNSVVGSKTVINMDNGLEMKKMSKKDDKQPLLSNNNKVTPSAPSSAGGIDIKVDVPLDDVEEDEMEELKAYLMEQQDDESEYKDDGYIELVLRVLGLMCDGQNRHLQDYLREQPDNIKSFNLVAETARFLSLIYSNINRGTVGLVTQTFDTLVEFTSGNTQNQGVVFDNKICDYINYILRGAAFQGCTPSQVLTIKSSIVTLVNAMVEENVQPQTKKTSLAKEVVESLDASSIHDIMIDCFTRRQTKGIEDDFKELVTTVGYQYYHVILRMMDLSSGITKESLVKTQLHHDAWAYYEAGTLSVEILKNEVLNRVYFRVKDKSVLREEIKEKFKYEVDRSSPSNKIREFMDWSQDIMQDIKIQKKILANPVARFFVQYWYVFNILAIWLSLFIAVTVLVGWKQPVYANGTTNYEIVPPAYWVPNLVYFEYVLFGLHNLVSLCIIVGYFLSNTPRPPKLHKISDWFRNKCGQISVHHKGNTDNDDEERESNLEVKIFSFKTFYYIAFFVLSVTGTIWYGYTFAFHLLHIAQNNQLLSRVIKAITKNGLSLVWVGVLIIIILYIFALISFIFFRDLYVSTKGLYCESMAQCLVTVTHRGFIMGPFEYFTEIADGRSFEWHALKAIFDLLFFIAITTIGLNVIFGIIVDTFSELRDSKWQTDQDMANTCFICSRSSYDFEHHGGGFEHHVKNEHNQWGYLFFFIHLSETRSNDYSALELYVATLLQQTNYDFFPLNCALSLQHTEDSKEMKLETMMQQVTYLVNKMKEEEMIRQQENEIKRQQAWLTQHQGILPKDQPKAPSFRDVISSVDKPQSPIHD